MRDPGRERDIMRECKKELVILSFTQAGTELNRTVCSLLCQRGMTCSGYTVKRCAGDGILPLPEEKAAFFEKRWGTCAFLFIGAAGIAVRYIAPWVKDKFTDSPVLVMDEKGCYVIPILSGHVGGAAELAEEIAQAAGAVPIHTTATDVQGKFAVDVFARKNGLVITDRGMAKKITAAVLDGEKIAFCASQDIRITGTMPEELVLCRDRNESEKFSCKILVADSDTMPGNGYLLLKPKNVVAGVGCRRGIREEDLEHGLRRVLGQHGLDLDQVEALASIDLKKEEPALLALSGRYRIPFVTYPAEELREIREVTQRSEFVEQTTGVDNVCERAAQKYCETGTMIQGKWIGVSMTAALVRRPAVLSFDI